nr:MAG TPA: hypothetical protein [Caudoviricetes sp.]
MLNSPAAFHFDFTSRKEKCLCFHNFQNRPRFNNLLT